MLGRVVLKHLLEYGFVVGSIGHEFVENGLIDQESLFEEVGLLCFLSLIAWRFEHASVDLGLYETALNVRAVISVVGEIIKYRHEVLIPKSSSCGFKTERKSQKEITFLTHESSIDQSLSLSTSRCAS